MEMSLTKGKIPIGTRVRWIAGPSFTGTISKHQRFMNEQGYLITWDNGKIGQHSESDFCLIEEPNDLMKSIL